MKRPVFIIFTLLFFISFVGNSQRDKNPKQLLDRCGTYNYNQELLKEYPTMMGSKVFEDKIKVIMESYKSQKTLNSGKRAVITIPVVVHVFHNGEPIGTGPNISDAQVFSQIKVLNEDFRKISGSRGDGGGVDVEVDFVLAKIDPSGCTTNGIDRVNIGQDGINENSQSNAIAQMDALKPTYIWDASLYLNMWSVKFAGGSGLLGYATPPGSGSTTDGVVVDYKFFGSNDDPNVTLIGPYNLGRTMTHEVGHFLGLNHVWGDNWVDGDPDDESCTADDGVADTPNSGRPNFGCPSTVPDTCVDPDDDMIENYMDYSDDVCFDTFTDGQKTRIQAILASSRASLASSTTANLPSGVNNDANAKVVYLDTPVCTSNITPSIRVTNYGDITLTSADISYNVDGGSSSTYNWTGTLTKGDSEIVNLPVLTSTSGDHTFNISVTSANGSVDQRSCNNSDSANFVINNTYDSTSKIFLTLVLDNFASETSWEFRDASNSLLASASYTSSDNGTTKNEEFIVSSNDCYKFTIFDSANDGICCGFGNGSYELKTDDDTVIATGGNFANSDVISISTATLGIKNYFLNNKISLYPNPTTSELNIKVSQINSLPDAFKIYNVLGQLVKEKQIDNFYQLGINVTSFRKGLYFIRIVKEGESISLPFIVE
ncbi:M43 family zinc metalloprotease [Hyunsoonleella aestuarii]|uniref:M43 family zinc metalloprotease n=1 Tax=Hyunsoonleella aestuarii TaxID=912802 RepID=UPI0011115840|nr:M43 family zinc metalloprotease [Hyunsoonleella aestuarii]